MKYYYYISDTKVEMLYSQIEAGAKKTIEQKIDLKILTRTYKVEEINKYSKLEKVCQFLQKYGDVGTLDQPGDYILDSIEMKWGPYARTESLNNPLVFFAGISDQTVIGLGGSRKHLIGDVGPEVAHSASGTTLFARYLMEVLELSKVHSKLYKILKSDTKHRTGQDTPDNQEYLDLMALACYTMKGPTEKLEFLAKTLISGTLSEDKYWQEKGLSGKKVLMATPIYVCRSDIPQSLLKTN